MPHDRRSIAEGISRDRYSLTARVQVGDRRVEKAFDRDTPIREIQKWREETRVQLRADTPRVVRGTLAAEVPRYLEQVKHRPASWKSKRSELAAWVEHLGHLRRHQITPEHVRRVIGIWVGKKVAPKTILNRCRTLHHLYVTLANDKRARTPLDEVDVPRPPKRKPQFVTVDVIKRVEKKLRAGDPQTHARYMVIASTGLRPSQLARLTAADVDLRRRLVMVAGGKGGEPIPLVLNGDQLAAFKAFVAANAWGGFDATKYARLVRAAGWPSDVRPYNARHAVGIELAERGVEDADIQAQLGHSDLDMVRQHYTGIRLSKMRRISQALEGRLGWQDVPRTLPRPSSRKTPKKTKTGQNSKGKKSA